MNNPSSDPPWIVTAMDLYKVLWIFNSSVNFYLYKIKILISKGKVTICCLPERHETQHEDMEFQVSVRTKSTRLYSQEC